MVIVDRIAKAVLATPPHYTTVFIIVPCDINVPNTIVVLKTIMTIVIAMEPTCFAHLEIRARRQETISLA